MTDIEARVIGFVAERAAVDPSRISLRTTLYGDLQIQGDDADDFFLGFGEQFGIALDGLNLSTYFPPEPYLGPGIVVAVLRRLFVSAEPHEVVRVAPLRVADLVTWAELKRITRTDGQARWA